MPEDTASMPAECPVPRRTRVLKDRQSHYGCYTCKDRKIKCDEARPECRKCTRTGRVCGGYRDSTNEIPVSKDVTLVPRTLPPQTNPRYGIISDYETLSLFEEGRIFLCCEMSEGLGVSDHFWKMMLPQMAHTDAGAHATCVALGAAVAYQRGKDRRDTSAIYLYYGRAISKIQRDLAERPEEVTCLVSMCLLLVITDLLMNRHNQALSHLQGSLTLLRRRQITKDKLGANHQFVISDVADLVGMILDISASSFALELSPRLPRLVTSDSRAVIDGHRTSDEELRVLTSLHASYAFLHEASRFKYVPTRFRPLGIEIDQRRHIGNLLSVLKSIGSDPGSGVMHSNNRTAALRAQCHSCLIWISTILDPRECAYDSYTQLFRTIVNDAKMSIGHILSPVEKVSSKFIADLGIVQPLWFTASKSRDLETRLEAIDLLRKSGRNGPFDGLILSAVARRVVEIEHSASTLSLLVPERDRICGCGPDIEALARPDAQSIKAFFSLCKDVEKMMAEETPDGYEENSHWEIWTEMIPL